MVKRNSLRQSASATCVVAALFTASAIAQPSQPAAPVLLPVRIDASEGKIMITLPPPGPDGVSGRFLYSAALRTGLGSASVRLDHGMTGPTEILAFRRLGKRIAATFENPRFRAAGAVDVQKGARESFPFSTIWMGDIVSTAPDGSVAIDIAPFLTRDTIDIAGALNEGAKGYKLVDSLSAVDPGSVRVFPDNIEMEAIQTFQSDTPAGQVNAIAPEPRQVSFVVHHSLIRLPEPGFVPRRFDIRSGAHGTQVFDFGTPLGEDVVYQLANRFRLEKVDPGASRSRVKKPIVFYIDRAAPEPVRTALADGVGWWSAAFDAAGFIDGFQVKILPEGVDPLDIRYNMINWSNRLTRGWSYGQSIVDPRTGEILKGSVVLGSLRVRQDMVIFEGLAGTAENNSGSANDPVQASLARIRQLGAHEVGHSLGFVHNFGGSTQGRTSVMDYPGPLIKVTDGKIDLSDAYTSGIGSWDKFTVDWLYGQPAPGIDPDSAARAKADEVFATGTRFVTDIDGRAPDSPNAWSSMWDNGPDPAVELVRMMDVRRVAIANFSTAMLRKDEPLSNLRRKFVPVWLLHRYQVEAAAKFIGGMDYGYAVVGDGRPDPAPVPAAAQLAALDALLATLAPDQLRVPDRLIGPLSSGVNGRSDPQYDIEVFDTAGAAVFDPLSAADAAAQVTLDTLLAPSRLTRVYQQHARDASVPGLETVLGKLIAAAVDARSDALSRRIAHRAILTLARTARDPESTPDVAAIIDDRLHSLADRLARTSGAGEDAAWSRSAARLLRDDEALERELAKRPRAPTLPPGMPIGSADSGRMDF